MLTKADDYPIHQTPDPIAFAQSAGLDVDSHYLGGFKDWVEAGGPVQKG